MEYNVASLTYWMYCTSYNVASERVVDESCFAFRLLICFRILSGKRREILLGKRKLQTGRVVAENKPGANVKFGWQIASNIVTEVEM